MRGLPIGTLLLSGAMMTLAAMDAAQAPAKAPSAAPRPSASNKIELSITYNPTISNLINSVGFGMQGASGQVHVPIYRGLGGVAEVSGLHSTNMHSSGVGMDLVTVLFGPRYTWAPAHAQRYELFGQGLVGGAYGLNSVFPDAGGYNRSATSLGAELGGGMNVRLTPHVWLRAPEAEWMRTQMPNSTTNVQNNIKLGFGFAFKY